MVSLLVLLKVVLKMFVALTYICSTLFRLLSVFRFHFLSKACGGNWIYCPIVLLKRGGVLHQKLNWHTTIPKSTKTWQGTLKSTMPYQTPQQYQSTTHCCSVGSVSLSSVSQRILSHFISRAVWGWSLTGASCRHYTTSGPDIQVLCCIDYFEEQVDGMVSGRKKCMIDYQFLW